MSETPKPTTRRRAVTIPKNTELPPKKEESFEEVSVENIPAESVVKQPTPEIPEEPIAGAMTEEDWEKEIEKAKQEKELRNSSAEPAPATTPIENQEQKTPLLAPKTEDAIELEVQRRLAEREKQRAAEAAKPEPPAAPTPAPGLSDEKKAEIAEKNDVSTFVNIPLGDEQDFIDAFEREIDEDDRPQSERENNPTPYAAGMAVVHQLGQTNNQQRLLAKWIGDIMERNTSALKGVEREMRLARITPKIGDGSGPKKLTGATARAAVVSRLKGMFRVQLYNSGFWLDLRPPTLIDIDSWMQSIDTEFKELGRRLGGHAHSVVDVYIKQKFFDILPTMVQRSNFEDYNDPNKLVSNISFHDYDTLLWAMCCMIFKDGIGAGIYCTNPECRHVDDHQYVDLKNICFLNTEIFNGSAMEWMTRGAHAGSKLLTEDDLRQYREEILGFKKSLTYDEGQTVYDLKVPTIKEFIDESASLISKMEYNLNGNHDVESDIVSNQLTFHLYKMLTPWVKTLSLYENGQLQYQIPDREAIYDSLDPDGFEGSNLYDDVADFIRDTKISFYSSTTLKCPKCGKVADLKHDNMFPLDMQYLFFCLSCHMLKQTGASY